MACYNHKVGIFQVLLLLFSFFFLCSGEVDLEALLARQEQQLSKLEGLVDSLSRSVSKLESSLPKPSNPSLEQFKIESCPLPPSFTTNTIQTPPPSLDFEVQNGVVGKGGGIAVTKRKPSWLEKFQFLAAAKLEALVTCATVLPYEDRDGYAKYLAVGDSNGMVYVFSAVGDVLIDDFVPSGSSVTAMVSYFNLGKNESILFTGHGDGSIVAHRILESSASNGDESPALSMGKSRIFATGGEAEDRAVAGLEVHPIGSVRYVVASDEDGRIRVFGENGKLHGTTVASSRILAFMKQRMLFLTETSAGWLDLRKVEVRETKCEGLNGSISKSYAFDAMERSKAYGLTLSGDLIHVMLLGDAGSLKCRVRAVRKTDIGGPVSIHALKGYLLVANNEKVFLYNVSSQYYGRVVAPRPLFSATLEEIKSLFAKHDVLSGGSAGEKPLIAGDREKLIVLGLGGGYIGIYRSKFPVFKIQNSTVLWTSPVLLFLMFLLGIWFFTVKKRQSLGLSPEEAFSPPTGASSSLVGSAAGNGDRAFVEDSRAGEARDSRTSVLRGPTRRYVSPSRFASGSSIPFRPNSADPSLRGAADLKLLRPLEPPGFPQRREGIFTANQVLDEHAD